MRFRVWCKLHHYDTLYTLDNVYIARTAAQMHSMLPCDEVQVSDSNDRIIDWREDEVEK
jgi:hypothetical protein